SDPVHIDVLAKLCQQQLAHIEAQLRVTERLGVINRVGDNVEIRLPIVRTKFYKSMPKTRRTRLNRAAFLPLKETECKAEAVAKYAFKGEMFAEAASLYRDLANDSYRRQQYREAVVQYRCAHQCNVQSDHRSEVIDSVNLARCYEWLGKYSPARQLYQR